MREVNQTITKLIFRCVGRGGGIAPLCLWAELRSPSASFFPVTPSHHCGALPASLQLSEGRSCHRPQRAQPLDVPPCRTQHRRSPRPPLTGDGVGRGWRCGAGREHSPPPLAAVHARVSSHPPRSAQGSPRPRLCTHKRRDLSTRCFSR